MALTAPLLAYYAVAMLVLSIYGVHRAWLVWCFVRHGRGETPAPARRFDELPRVTVQLPLFNEPRVARRVIEAAAAMDYPREKLQIQVLDDSTGGCESVARRCCRRLARRGVDIEHIHRRERHGYKAGALAAGMERATGELIALFDADFVPPRDFLQRTVHHFTDPAVGMVQARWAHLNRDASLLTRLQAMSLDAHFVIEQPARAAAGRWFNFNGTAGVWRRACIEEAGGWQHDTLTEDTDLSYRAQLASWRFVYLADLCCPAELPATIGALLSQQHRWNKGLMQTAIKLLPRILWSRAPLSNRVEAFFHLTAPLPYAFMLLLVLLVLPSLIVLLPSSGAFVSIALAAGLTCLALGTGSVSLFYIAAQRAQGRPLGAALAVLPALLALGVGVSLVNTRGVIEAIFGRASPFVRTPKTGGAGRSSPDVWTSPLRLPRCLGELALGLLMLACIVPALREPVVLVGSPFLLLFAAGFLGIAGGELLSAAVARRALRRRAARRTRREIDPGQRRCDAPLLLAAGAGETSAANPG